MKQKRNKMKPKRNKMKQKIDWLYTKIADKFYWFKYKLNHKKIPSMIGEGSKLFCVRPNGEIEWVLIKRLWIEFGHNGSYDKFYIMADTDKGMSTLNALLEHYDIVSIDCDISQTFYKSLEFYKYLSNNK